MKYIIIVISFVLFGCASIVTGTSDELTFTSTPDSAVVYIDQVEIGTAPLTLDVDRELHNSDITFKAGGCEDTHLKLARTFNKWSIGNLTFLLGWGIDAITGAIMKAKVINYHADLECPTVASIPPARYNQ